VPLAPPRGRGHGPVVDANVDTRARKATRHQVARKRPMATVLATSRVYAASNSRGLIASATAHGSRSCTRLVGWSAMRSITWRRYASGSRPLSFAPCCQSQSFTRSKPIEMLAADSANQPFDGRMRHGQIGDRLDSIDLENAKVGEPAEKADRCSQRSLSGHYCLALIIQRHHSG